MGPTDWRRGRPIAESGAGPPPQLVVQGMMLRVTSTVTVFVVSATLATKTFALYVP
jgi:hypothetical protein